MTLEGEQDFGAWDETFQNREPVKVTLPDSLRDILSHILEQRDSQDCDVNDLQRQESVSGSTEVQVDEESEASTVVRHESRALRALGLTLVVLLVLWLGRRFLRGPS